MLEGSLLPIPDCNLRRSMCCKFEQLVLNAFEGTSSLTKCKRTRMVCCKSGAACAQCPKPLCR
jgi:hypothetical protein